MKTLGLKLENLEILMFLNSLLGCVEVISVCRSCGIMIRGEKLKFDLIILAMSLFDMVFRMDWLSRYRAIVDCYRRRVILITSLGAIITYQGGINQIVEDQLLKYCVRG